MQAKHTSEPEESTASEELFDLPSFPALPGEQQFLDLVLLMRPLGFGRMMQIISYTWHEIDPIGALSVGTCYGLLDEPEKDRKEATKRSDPLDYSKANDQQGGAL